MFSTSDCLAACKEDPVRDLESVSKKTVEDLILGHTATSKDIPHEHVLHAFSELIALQYPLINRLLETAAYLCAAGVLKIYHANPDEFHSLPATDRCGGYFNSTHGLIVLSTHNNLSQTLIHEITHAVRYYLLSSSFNNSCDRHSNFCRTQFPTLFATARKRQREYTASEREELGAIEGDVRTMQSLASEHVRHNSFSNWDNMMKESEKTGMKFRNRRLRVEANMQVRGDLHQHLQLYQTEKLAEEFLPFFLQYFVKYACHEEIRALRYHAAHYVWSGNMTADTIYQASLPALMMDALGPDIAEEFVNGNFRRALDAYVALSVKSYLSEQQVEQLTDHSAYSIYSSMAEPIRIDNSQPTFKF